MNKEQLKQLVARFSSARAFVDSFNTAAGFEALDETVLNNQLAGRRGLSKAWQAAYTIFNKIFEHERTVVDDREGYMEVIKTEDFFKN